MAKIDKANSHISYLKFWLGIAVAVIIGILGWVFTSYTTANVALLFGGIALAVVLTVLVLFLNKKILREIDELEDI